MWSSNKISFLFKFQIADPLFTIAYPVYSVPSLNCSQIGKTLSIDLPVDKIIYTFCFANVLIVCILSKCIFLSLGCINVLSISIKYAFGGLFI